MTSSSSMVLGPLIHAHGTVVLPGSKSISNRALLLAALSPGTTRLTGLLDSEDTQVMLAALRELGIEWQRTAPDEVSVHGCAEWPRRRASLYLANAGTAFRPLAAVLAVLGGDYRLSGVARMHERPIGDLVDALRSLGCSIEYLQNEGYPPLQIDEARLAWQEAIAVRGSVSSQFLTALLMAAPLATSRVARDLSIEIDGPLISRPYIDITLDLMRSFGVTVQHDEADGRFVVSAQARYVSPGTYAIEGDASSASYFIGLGSIAGGPVRIEGLGANSIQGDLAFAAVAEAMGAQVVREPHALVISGKSVARGERLRAFDMDFNLLPDAAMTAAVLALYADGPCHLRNIASWRVKETDRIDAMHAELARLGARVEQGPDYLRVWPLERSNWQAASIQTYDDHRMAMCFSLAAFGPHPVTILDPGCVRKTFPEYFTAFRSLLPEDAL